MIFRKSQIEPVQVEGVHDGKGKMMSHDMLKGYAKEGAGFKFVHDNILEPGGTIGEHMHHDDEEMYIILSGHGIMIEDGVQHEINDGDISLVTSGHSHGLINSTDSPMHLLVVGIGV